MQKQQKKSKNAWDHAWDDVEEVFQRFFIETDSPIVLIYWLMSVLLAMARIRVWSSLSETRHKRGGNQKE